VRFLSKEKSFLQLKTLFVENNSSTTCCLLRSSADEHVSDRKETTSRETYLRVARSNHGNNRVKRFQKSIFRWTLGANKN